MRIIIIFSIFLVAMLLTSCMSKTGWIDTVKGKTFYSDSAAMIFDNKANMQFDIVDTDSNYNNTSNSNEENIEEQTITSIFEAMDFIFISSPEQNKSVYEINVSGQKIYQGFSTDGKNVYSYGDVTNEPKNINWYTRNPNVYSLK